MKIICDKCKTPVEDKDINFILFTSKANNCGWM
jgi:hypothetical protein